MPHVNELHEQHDPMLVVSFASGDLAPDDRDRATAQSLVESCTDCARLHDDVIAIAKATKALPPATRTRDFQLSPEQAATLRPAGLRRFLAGLAAPGSIFTRQLGAGLATLGIAGLLISGMPSISLGGSAASASAAPEMRLTGPADNLYAPSEVTGEAVQGLPDASAAASAPAASSYPVYAAGGAEAGASASPGPDAALSSGGAGSADGFGPMASPESIGRDTGTSRGNGEPNVNPAPAPLAPPSGPSGLVIVSSILLATGLLVLAVRFIARRAAAD
jgi:hypothetical protein